MARCVLIENKLPKMFWVETLAISVYLLNKLPINSLVDKTPYEAWFLGKSSVIHLRVFGCICYVHVPKIKRDKLDRKATAAMFIGYIDTAYNYKVFIIETEKVYVSRNVKFNENKHWNWDKSKIKQLQVQFRQV